MSHKEKMAELRQHLEGWKHSVDAHSSHAHQALYEFLSKLLKLWENESSQPAEATPEDIASQEAETVANDDPPGGNNPGAPDIP